MVTETEPTRQDAAQQGLAQQDSTHRSLAQQSQTPQDQTPQNAACVWTIKSALEWTQGHLEAKGDENPRLSAQWLLCAATGLSRLELYTNYEQVLTSVQLAVLREGIKRRVTREPLQYIMGKAPFRKIELSVRQGVLIPRPETEVLVDIVIGELRDKGILETARILDLCTGSGNIALSLLQECPGVQLVATDNDPAAVQLARENAALLGFGDNDGCDSSVDNESGGDNSNDIGMDNKRDGENGNDIGADNKSFGDNGNDNSNDNGDKSGSDKSDDGGNYDSHSKAGRHLRILLDDLAGTLISDPKMEGSFDVVVSNPPYVPTAELEKLTEEVANYEPRGALDGGVDGLDVFRRIVGQARTLLKPYGLLACELFETTLNEAAEFCIAEGFIEVLIHNDLTDRPRIITARTPRGVSL